MFYNTANSEQHIRMIHLSVEPRQIGVLTLRLIFTITVKPIFDLVASF